jgi:hypothetical protein
MPDFYHKFGAASPMAGVFLAVPALPRTEHESNFAPPSKMRIR